MELSARCDSAGFLMCSIGTKILITPEICTSVVFRRSDSLCRGERLRCFDTNAQIPPAKVFLWLPRHDASGLMHLRSREDENRFETARSDLSSGAFCFVFCQTNTPRQRRRHWRDERDEMKRCSCSCYVFARRVGHSLVRR